MRSSAARCSVLVHLLAATRANPFAWRAFSPCRQRAVVSAVLPHRGSSPHRLRRFMSSNDDNATANKGYRLADTGGTASSSPVSVSSSQPSPPLSWWRTRLQVASEATRKTRGSNYVQVATVDAQGLPCCRTLVFRGFLDSSTNNNSTNNPNPNLPCRMKMITDARSDKVLHLAANPTAELVWWFAAPVNEQYRIRGTLHVVGPLADSESDSDDNVFWQDARAAQWDKLTDAARESFYDPHPPGTIHTDTPSGDNDDKATIPPGGRTADGAVLQPPPETFLLLLLQPTRVDYLRLGAQQYRQVDVCDATTGVWTSTRVNP